MCTAKACLCKETSQGSILLGKPRGASSIKLNEVMSFFIIRTKRIKLMVLLVGICINKLQERGSSVGTELSMYGTVTLVNVL